MTTQKSNSELVEDMFPYISAEAKAALVETANEIDNSGDKMVSNERMEEITELWAKTVGPVPAALFGLQKLNLGPKL